MFCALLVLFARRKENESNGNERATTREPITYDNRLFKLEADQGGDTAYSQNKKGKLVTTKRNDKNDLPPPDASVFGRFDPYTPAVEEDFISEPPTYSNVVDKTRAAQRGAESVIVSADNSGRYGMTGKGSGEEYSI